MSKKENFTADRVAQFKCQEGKTQCIFWDGKTPGLGLRVTATGIKSYIFETRLHGKTLRTTIGDSRTWSIGNAQAEARRLKTLTDQGIDPREQKAQMLAAAEAKREKARRETELSLAAWETYLDARKGKWSPRTLLDHQRLSSEGGKIKMRGKKQGESDKTIPGILMPLLSKPLNEINSAAVRAWLTQEVQQRPTQANNAYVRLRAFLNWCSEQPEFADQAHTDACTTRLARDILPKLRAKDDCLQREQLPVWFEKVKLIMNPGISTYLQIALLTGARREEVAGIRWEDIDFQWKTIGIADKVEGNRTIPMTPYVESLLLDLKLRNETPPPKYRILDGKKIENDLTNWKPSHWVFSSKKAASGRLQDPSIQHRAACASAGIEGLTIHGLRRSFGTLAEWVECPAGVVAQIMGHKPSATAEKHYRRRPIDLLRMWHTKIECWILEQAGIEQTTHSTDSGLKIVA